MADSTTSQILFNGPRHLVYRLTNVSDGTGETAVTKIDALAAVNGVVVAGQTLVPGTRLKVTKAVYSLRGMGLRIQWHATSNEDMLVLRGSSTMHFRRTGGIQNPGTADLPGATGSIDFTTVDADAGDSYSVVLYCTKGIPGAGLVATVDGIAQESGVGFWLLEDGVGIWAWG